MLLRHTKDEPSEPLERLPGSEQNRRTISIIPKRTSTERPFSGQDLTGKRFTRWTVLGLHGFVRTNVSRENGRWIVSHRRAIWNCRCDCGYCGEIEGMALRSKHSQSCGCFNYDNPSIHRREGKKIHGQSKTKIYRSWSQMKTRCLNPRRDFWKDYGGRGISFCRRWDKFLNFQADMAEKWFEGASLERKNVNGNYTLKNCVWATALEQANNTRCNRFVKFKGRTQTVTQWAREIKMCPFTLYGRLNRWSVRKSLTYPLRKPKGN